MSQISKRNKALTVKPLKASQGLGAALAFLGFAQAIPLFHGSQGCTAFAKVFFVRHFREPIPLQTTAMDQISTVMGAEESVVSALATICSKNRQQPPALIGIPTTGLSETQGSDVSRAIQLFRQHHPEYAATAVVTVATPDYSGSLESGFARAIEAVIQALVPAATTAGTAPGTHPRQVNVLVSATFTAGDLEALDEIIRSFALEPLFIPNISDSLDGHLDSSEFNPLSSGGTSVAALKQAGNALATLVIGASMQRCGDALKQLTGVNDYRFDHLMGLAATDALLLTLSEISGNPVPLRLERQRSQYQDALLDCHFSLGMSRIAIAAEPELLHGLAAQLLAAGAEIVAAVSPTNSPLFERCAVEAIKIGDLEDLERLAGDNAAELLISNSHAVASAEALGIPLLRAGFPQYDTLGGQQRCWIGYRGGRQTLFDLSNLLLASERGEIPPYRSIYSQKGEESSPHGQAHRHSTPFTTFTQPAGEAVDASRP
ncbi:MAG: nitrogenase iron-molybdenum cofactor biosynthesis protein NifN [Gammaproteobacteria bacterium]|nr:nitrogenase iron-molybdenum cofactor biosynthesis protein NifN [Gammaproteobacteria bacterium]